MKVKLSTTAINTTYLSKESYEVMGYYQESGGKFWYILLSDVMHFPEIFQDWVIVLDHDKSDFKDYSTRHMHLFMKPIFDEIINKHFDEHIKGDIFDERENFWKNIQENDIWTRTRLAAIFSKLGYELTEELKNALTNEKHKLALIDGFLKFANIYTDFSIDHLNNLHRKELDFAKRNGNIESLEITEYSGGVKKILQSTIREIELSKYKKSLFDYIESSLTDDSNYSQYNLSDEKIISLTYELFFLIDSLFVDKVERVFTYSPHAAEYFMFVMEYRGSYYSLESEWSYHQ